MYQVGWAFQKWPVDIKKEECQDQSKEFKDTDLDIYYWVNILSI